MIKVKNRIKKHAEFQTIIQQRKLVKNEMYSVYVATNNCHHGRIGISVSKKIGNAVIRNLVKRQVRAMINEDFDFTCEIDVVIIVRGGYQIKEYSLCRTKLKNLLVKIGRIKE